MTVAESILRKLLDEIVQKQNKNGEISLKPLTSGGANYTSVLYSISITYPDQNELKLFAKVANVSEMMRQAMNIGTMFETEQYVYGELSKVYEQIQDKNNIEPNKRFVFPKYFGGNSNVEEETVIMEDLVAKGYAPYSRFKCIDWEHIASAVQALAGFHALSFAFQKEDPENFQKASEKLSFKMKDSKDPNMIEAWGRMMRGAVQVCEEQHKERLKEMLLTAESRQQFHKFKKPLSTSVLCHGDYRVSNLLFRRQNNQVEAIVVDYQTVHTGSPVTDLLYLEVMGTDQAFRDKHHQRLIDYYFSELSQALDRVGVDVNEVYPRETFDMELREMLPVTICIAAVILPLVLVEAEQAPQLGSVSKVTDIALSPTQLFAERYRGFVSDCAKWGVL